MTHAEPLNDLTAFQRDALVAVGRLDGEPHGLAIKAELGRYYEGEVHHGRLYPNLDALVEKGLLRKQTADARTNAYILTARARRELRIYNAWVATALVSPPPEAGETTTSPGEGDA